MNKDSASKESESKLKLTICEQHKEKNSQNLNRNFKLLRNDLILSSSIFIHYQIPFLLSENTNDTLKRYLPTSHMNYIRSNILLDSFAKNLHSPLVSQNSIGYSSEQINDKEDNMHEFLLIHLSRSFDDSEFKKLYADYKSRGGIAAINTTKRLILTLSDQNLGLDDNHQPVAHQTNKKQSIVASMVSSPLSKFDCLDVFNRQHLAVLFFFNQCETSPLYPNICNKPRIINFKFYGENDMTLGSFLAKNCFRPGYKCSNEICDTLIVYHTRS